jgi:hypothetical protein
MTRLITVIVALVLQFGCSENFDGVANSNALVSPLIECNEAVYEGTCCRHTADVPDDDPKGTTLGPLSISGIGGVIADVVLSLEISHPQTADLRAKLHYDADNDGVYDASSPVEIYLARPDPCDGEELWACPIRLNGTYFFRDESWESFGEKASFKVFEGLSSSGSFYLTLVDNLAGDMGSVKSWGVFVDCGFQNRRS